jgi:hypothetical protein
MPRSILGLPRWAFVAAILGLLLPGAPMVAASEPVKGAVRVGAGKSKLVFVIAGFDAACRSTTYPTVTIDAPAAKGRIILRPGETTTVQYSVSGRCIGAKVEGVAIYYVAADDADGADVFSISARMPSGEVATRMFHIHITD